jgi:hypothetical protein
MKGANMSPGSRIESGQVMRIPLIRFDSIRSSREFDSDEIDESNLHRDTHDDPTLSISTEIATSDDDEKLQVRQRSITSILTSS